jgi:HSP20 family protein
MGSESQLNQNPSSAVHPDVVGGTAGQEKDLDTKQAAMGNSETTRGGYFYRPDVDIYETADAVWVAADVPGAAQEDVDISFEEGMLTIQAAVKPRGNAERKPLRREYGVGGFYRAFQLAETIEVSKIEAQIKNGVLTLKLPKSEKARPRKIPVQ